MLNNCFLFNTGPTESNYLMGPWGVSTRRTDFGDVFNGLNVLLAALGVKDVRNTGTSGSSCHQIEHGWLGNQWSEKWWLEHKRKEELKKLLLGVVKCSCLDFCHLPLNSQVLVCLSPFWPLSAETSQYRTEPTAPRGHGGCIHANDVQSCRSKALGWTVMVKLFAPPRFFISMFFIIYLVQ